MAVFRVRINAENLINVINGNHTCCGFIKNEYVWAKDKNEAAMKAEARVRKKVAVHPSLFVEDGSDMKLKIEAVEKAANPLKFVSDEGFIFYDNEDGVRQD